MTKHFLSIREFCTTYGVGRTKTYGLIAAGEIEARKVGSRTKITMASAERWAQALPAKPLSTSGSR